MGFVLLDRYDVVACARECSKRDSDPVGGACHYFNIWRAVIDGVPTTYTCSMVNSSIHPLFAPALLTTRFIIVLPRNRRFDSHQHRPRLTQRHFLPRLQAQKLHHRRQLRRLLRMQFLLLPSLLPQLDRHKSTAGRPRRHRFLFPALRSFRAGRWALGIRHGATPFASSKALSWKRCNISAVSRSSALPMSPQ